MIKKNTITVLKQTGTVKSKLSDYSLFVDPVDKVEELDFWEKRLSYLKVPYIVAEFEVGENSKTNRKKIYRRGYGIFVDPMEIED